MDHKGNEIESEDPFEARVLAIDPAISPPERARILKPILQGLASLDALYAEAIVNHTIKKHFGLTDKEVKPCLTDLSKHRKIAEKISKSQDQPKTQVGNSQDELIEQLKSETNIITVNPAQDFYNGRMYFTVKIKGAPYLLSSDRELISFEQAEKHGISLKHKLIDTTRFSPDAAARYLEGDYRVDVPELYDRICKYIKRFVFFTDQRWVYFLGLWVMGTYLYKVFNYYPYVWLHAEKQSGKSLLMKILSRIAFNGDVLIHPTAAVVFRDVSQNSISMFIDEVEQLRKQDKDLHGDIMKILNSGFENSGVVKRMEQGKGGEWVLKVYSAYSPKMFAGINEIHDVLQDRTIEIKMLRKKENEVVERYKENASLLKLHRSIRDDLYVFALAQAHKIADVYQQLTSSTEKVTGLPDRELDIWEPMFLLSDLVDGDGIKGVIRYSMEELSQDSTKEKHDDSLFHNETCRLLTVTKGMIEELTPLEDSNGMLVYRADEAFSHFKQSEEFSWLERRNALTVRLKRIKVKAERVRFDGKRIPVYKLSSADLEDLYERYVDRAL